MEVNNNTIEKIRGKVFSPLDILIFDLVIEVLVRKDREEEDYIPDEVLQQIEQIIAKGDHWSLNPTNHIFGNEDFSEFTYNTEKLRSDIHERSHIEFEEIDNNLELMRVEFPVEMIVFNMQYIKNELLEKSNQIFIRTFFGEIEL